MIYSIKRAALLVATVAVALTASMVTGHIVTTTVKAPGQKPQVLKTRGDQPRLRLQGGEDYALPAEVAGGCGHGHEKLNGHVNIMKRTANACGVFDMTWNVNEKANYIDIEMHSRGVGWVAMGIQDVGGKLLDTATGFIRDGVTKVVDGTTPGLVQPTVDKIQNLKVLSSRQDETGTWIKFRKPLTSNDKKFDVQLSRKKTYLVGWAVHRTVDDINRVHQYRGLFEINFFSDKRFYTPEVPQPPGVHDRKGNCLKCPCNAKGDRVVKRTGVGGRRLLDDLDFSASRAAAVSAVKARHAGNPMMEYVTDEQWATLTPDYDAATDPMLAGRAGSRRGLSFHTLLSLREDYDAEAHAAAALAVQSVDYPIEEYDEENDEDEDATASEHFATQGWGRRRRRPPPPPRPPVKKFKPPKPCPRCPLCRKEKVIKAPKNQKTQCGYGAEFSKEGLQVVPLGATIDINVALPGKLNKAERAAFLAKGRTMSAKGGRRLLTEEDAARMSETEIASLERDDNGDAIVSEQMAAADVAPVTVQSVVDEQTDDGASFEDVDEDMDDDAPTSLMSTQFFRRRRRRRPPPPPPPPPNCPCGHTMIKVSGGRRLLGDNEFSTVDDDTDFDSMSMQTQGWGGRRKPRVPPPVFAAQCNCCPCLCMCGPSSESGKAIPGQKCKTCACRSCDQEPYPPKVDRREPPGTIDVRMKCGNGESLAANKMASAPVKTSWKAPVPNLGTKSIKIDLPAEAFGKNGNSLTDATCTIATTYSTNKNSVCTDIKVRRPHPYPACAEQVKKGLCPSRTHYPHPDKQDPSKDSGHCAGKECKVEDCCALKQTCQAGMCPPPKFTDDKELRGEPCAGPRCTTDDCCVQLFPNDPTPTQNLPDPNAKNCAGFGACVAPDVLVSHPDKVQCEGTRGCRASVCCTRKAVVIDAPTPTPDKTPTPAPTPTAPAVKKPVLCSSFQCPSSKFKPNKKARTTACKGRVCDTAQCCNPGGRFRRGDVHLDWEIENGTVTFTLSRSAQGWMGLGFGPVHTGMDVYQMRVKGSGADFFDGWAPVKNGYKAPTRNAKSKAKAISGSMVGGRQTVVWSRPLAGDKTHTAITKGKSITVSWAACTSNNFAAQHDMTDAGLVDSAPIVIWQ